MTLDPHETPERNQAVAIITDAWALAFQAEPVERASGSYWSFPNDRARWPSHEFLYLAVRLMPPEMIIDCVAQTAKAVRLPSGKMLQPDGYDVSGFYKRVLQELRAEEAIPWTPHDG